MSYSDDEIKLDDDVKEEDELDLDSSILEDDMMTKKTHL